MDEYIKRQDAIDAMKRLPHEYKNKEQRARTGGIAECQMAVRGLPPADVKPVVTCGKCKYGKYTGASWFCDKHSGHADKFGEDASYHVYHSKYWFCADGEEKNHD